MSRAALIACVALAALAVASAPSAHGAPASCGSGRTVFQRGRLRVFVVVRAYRPREQEGSSYKTFYLCHPGWERAHVIVEGSPYTRESAYGFRVTGHRLGFFDYSEGVQSGSDLDVGWIDLWSARVRVGEIHASEGLQSESEEEPGLPRVPDDHVGYAVARDGTVAVLGEGGEPPEWQVCVLDVRRHSLGPPRVLARVAPGGEGLDPGSIAIDAASVTWRTTRGTPGSAPRRPARPRHTT